MRGWGRKALEEKLRVPQATLDPARMALVLDPVAEAIYTSIFEGELSPGGIERALYRQAAEAALRAGVAAFLKETV